MFRVEARAQTASLPQTQKMSAALRRLVTPETSRIGFRYFLLGGFTVEVRNVLTEPGGARGGGFISARFPSSDVPVRRLTCDGWVVTCSL